MKKKKHGSVDGFISRRYQTSSLDDHIREDAQTTLGHAHQHRIEQDEELHSGVEDSPRPDAPSGIKEDIGASLREIDADATENKQKKSKKRTTRRRIKWVSLLAGAIILITSGFLLIKAWQVGGQMFQGNLLGIFQRQQLKTDSYGRSNILILGSTDDMVGRDGASLTDSMMVVSVDQQKKDAYMFSIPRDLWVDYGRACLSGYEGKINEFYACAAEGDSKEAELARMNDTRELVGEIFDMDIQYVVHVNTIVIRDGVNAVGGITVNVESDDERGVLDSTFDNMCKDAPDLCPNGHFMQFKNGPNKMNGDQAMAFSQARGMGELNYGFMGSNFAREKNQQLVLMALKDKATSTGTLTDITKVMGLMDAMGDNLRTNVDPKEIQTALWLASETQQSNIHRLSFVDEKNVLMVSQSVGVASAVVPAAGMFNYTEIRAFLRENIFATPLTQEGATVLVLNGGGPTGSAQTEADNLTAAGLKVIGVDNATEEEAGTYVLYQIAEGEKPLARAKLQELYDVKLRTTQPPFSPPASADYVLVIGAQAPTKVVQ